MALSRRDKFFKTVRREMEGYIPYDFDLSPSQIERFRQKTGAQDYRDYYDLPMRFVAVSPEKRNIDFMKYFDSQDGGITFDEWGVGHKKGTLEHFTKMQHPMENFQSLEEFQKYPYPDPVKDYKWDGFAEKVAELKERDLIVVASMAITIFEIAWYLRGMERFLIDMMTDPELACYHMDRITSIRCECARRYVMAGVDVLHIGDDVATQIDMMMSPDVWREFLKPRLKKVIDAAREVKEDIIIDYHSDGNIQKIIPDLIEIGVDVLNPVQPECMDPVEIKQQYGDRLSFRGTIGTQTVMPFGTPEEVDEVCREMIQKVGKGGGFILAPTHVIEPEVPWENIEAMINAVKKYPRY